MIKPFRSHPAIYAAIYSYSHIQLAGENMVYSPIMDWENNRYLYDIQQVGYHAHVKSEHDIKIKKKIFYR